MKFLKKLIARGEIPSGVSERLRTAFFFFCWTQTRSAVQTSAEMLKAVRTDNCLKAIARAEIAKKAYC